MTEYETHTGSALDAARTSGNRGRIAALDVVRGFALCGVLVANVQPIAATAGLSAVAPVSGGGAAEAVAEMLVPQRFYPIFAVLFGVGFALLLESASRRGVPRPRVVLLRRLLTLLAIGAAHHLLLWEGEILAVYAVAGLVVLLPSTWLPRAAVAILGAALTGAALAAGAGHFATTPGLFLLGAALTRYGVIARIESSTRVPLFLGLACTVLSAPALWWQAVDARHGMAVAGLLIATAYVCALLVLLRTRARGVLRAVFAPLGRMALTNYLTATLLVLGIARVVGGAPHAWPMTTVLLIAGGVLTVQWAWSALWLRGHPHGPVERLWRWATWASVPTPLLRR